MISIAHPDFRDELFYEAKKMGLFSAERTLTESIHGVYPVSLEEVRKIDGESVTVRPAKPVDERRIQEHYYNLDKNDVISRFFHEKTSFLRNQVEGISQIDYVKNLSMLAVAFDRHRVVYGAGAFAGRTGKHGLGLVGADGDHI